jgi:hypothetical protein
MTSPLPKRLAKEKKEGSERLDLLG